VFGSVPPCAGLAVQDLDSFPFKVKYSLNRGRVVYFSFLGLYLSVSQGLDEAFSFPQRAGIPLALVLWVLGFTSGCISMTPPSFQPRDGCPLHFVSSFPWAHFSVSTDLSFFDSGCVLGRHKAKKRRNFPSSHHWTPGSPPKSISGLAFLPHFEEISPPFPLHCHSKRWLRPVVMVDGVDLIHRVVFFS